MHLIDTIYIDGAFVRPHGDEIIDMIDPATEAVIGTVRLADAVDAGLAVAAATRALPAMARTSVAERIAMLGRLHDAVLARNDELHAATITEYGGPSARAAWVAQFAAQTFLDAARALEETPLTRSMGSATVVLEPVGVAALVTPWNSSAGSMCSKLAMALAAGCSVVIKPSEASPLQTRIVSEAFHAAALPPGVVNIVTGRGQVVVTALTAHPDVAAISFTGSTAVGKLVMQQGAASMKRLGLALSGKSATVLLDDADLGQAIPLAVNAAFQNNGQACVAGTRLLVPRHLLDEVTAGVRAVVAAMKVGDPRDPATHIGPLASAAKFERIQKYIALGLAEGAQLVAGGPGRPEGRQQGWFVRPTVFAGVDNSMVIAREEIFGPVLCIIAYDDEAQAIAIANDSDYGLQAYVLSSDLARARRVADALKAGRVLINTLQHEPLAPFGGYKQSGLGREFGVFGLEAFLEVKSVIAA